MNQNPSLIDVAEPNQIPVTEMGIDCGGICGECSGKTSFA